MSTDPTFDDLDCFMEDPMEKRISLIARIVAVLTLLTVTGCVTTPYKLVHQQIVSGKAKRELKVFISRDKLDSRFNQLYEAGALTC